MEKFDLVLENAFYKAKSTILEEAGSAEEGKRAELVLTEAATSLQKVKDFVKQHKGKLAALAAAGLAAGAYGAGRAGYLGQGAQEAIKGFEGKVGDVAGQVGEKASELVGKAKEGVTNAVDAAAAKLGYVPQKSFNQLADMYNKEVNSGILTKLFGR